MKGWPAGTKLVITGPMDGRGVRCVGNVVESLGETADMPAGIGVRPGIYQRITAPAGTGHPGEANYWWSVDYLRPLDGDTDASDDAVVVHYTLSKLRESAKAA